MLKNMIFAVFVVILLLILSQLILAGLLGGIGPLKFLQSVRMRRLPGNAPEYDMTRLTAKKDSPFAGKTMIALGSSVTFGAASMEQAVGEYLSARLGMRLIKEAVSGTTLSDIRSSSYVSRMQKKLNPNMPCDLFLCQLSTNDASQNIPLGEIAPKIPSSRNPVSSDTLQTYFDTKTVTGAIEYIVTYVRLHWHCPVVFYTGSYYESPAYAAMVKRIHELCEKYDCLYVLDLYSGRKFNDVSPEEYQLYMKDIIHPTRAGYLKWWGPELECQLMKKMNL